MMRLTCVFGHEWHGCVCSRCKNTRNVEHDWSKDCEKCVRCGAVRDGAHHWSKDCEKCARCGTVRDGSHDWSKDCERCARCGTVRDGSHDWGKDCQKCAQCGTVRDGAHDWSKDCEKCARCGTVRGGAHDWRNDRTASGICWDPPLERWMPGWRKCAQCGVVQDKEHKWKYIGSHGEWCLRCGKTRAKVEGDLWSDLRSAIPDLEKIRALLTTHPDLVSSTESNCETPLHAAAGGGHRDVVELLLANYAYVNATTRLGGPVDEELTTMTTMRDVEVVRVATWSALHDRETPLHRAAEGGHKDVVELLLANKADVNARTPEAVTPLHWAAARGHRDVVELLLANKADVNAKFTVSPRVVRSTRFDDTPLHWAAERGHRDVVELLLANGADVNRRNHLRKSPLDLAAESGHKDVVELLRQHGGFE